MLELVCTTCYMHVCILSKFTKIEINLANGDTLWIILYVPISGKQSTLKKNSIQQPKAFCCAWMLLYILDDTQVKMCRDSTWKKISNVCWYEVAIVVNMSNS